MLWLAVHFPNWLLQYQSHYQGEAIVGASALYDSLSQRVLAVCPTGAHHGVHVNQSVTTAQALLPSLNLIAYETSIGAQACDWLCQWSYRYSARVVPLRCQHDSNSSPHMLITDTLLLEVGSMLKVFGTLDNLLKQYMAEARRYGLQCQFAIGDNPLLVQISAKHLPLAVELLAERSGGETVASADHRRLPLVKLEQLANLSIALLPLANEVQLACENMGIVTLAQLLQLPVAELGERFGVELLTLLARFRGELPQTFECYQPPEVYQHKLTLLYEVTHIEGVLFPLSRMLEGLSEYLIRRQQAALAVRLTFEYRDRSLPPLSCVLRYPFGEHRSEALLVLCRAQLDRLVLSEPVISLSVALQEAVPLRIEAQRWWHGSEKTDASLRLLALLEARLGSDKVKGLACGAGILPEHSWQGRSLAQWRAGQSCHESKAPYRGRIRSLCEEELLTAARQGGMSDGGIRPNWLLAQVVRVDEQSVFLLKGPERIASPWHMDGQARDYYLARHRDGGLCWVFRDTYGLFIQGWFA